MASVKLLSDLEAVRPYTEALTSGDIEFAIGIAKELPSDIAKDIARDIWGVWKAMVAGRMLPACPF